MLTVFEPAYYFHQGKAKHEMILNVFEPDDLPSMERACAQNKQHATSKGTDRNAQSYGDLALLKIQCFMFIFKVGHSGGIYSRDVRMKIVKLRVS